MSSSSVWVQLVIGEQKGDPFEIEPIPKDINALKDAVKAKLKPILDYTPVSGIFVYLPGTDVTTEGYKNSRCKPWDEVPTTGPLPGSTIPRPLIVVATASEQEGVFGIDVSWTC